jgi:hypothetical protein
MQHVGAMAWYQLPTLTTSTHNTRAHLVDGVFLQGHSADAGANRGELLGAQLESAQQRAGQLAVKCVDKTVMSDKGR